MPHTDALWLIQAEDDIPPDDGWLSPEERLTLAGLRFPRRRRDWRLGRWTAKRAIASWLGSVGRSVPPLSEIVVRPASDGAPEVRTAGDGRAPAISISHRDGIGLCAVAAPGSRIGCDIEAVEPRSRVFITDYMTPAEVTLHDEAPEGTRTVLLAGLWSAKESALKLVRTGLRADTRSVTVRPSGSPPGGHWNRLMVSDSESG